MTKYITLFEKLVIAVLTIMMALVVLLATVELGWAIVHDMNTPPVFLFDLDELLELFGSFLLV